MHDCCLKKQTVTIWPNGWQANCWRQRRLLRREISMQYNKERCEQKNAILTCEKSDIIVHRPNLHADQAVFFLVFLVYRWYSLRLQWFAKSTDHWITDRSTSRACKAYWPAMNMQLVCISWADCFSTIKLNTITFNGRWQSTMRKRTSNSIMWHLSWRSYRNRLAIQPKRNSSGPRDEHTPRGCLQIERN